MMAPAVARPDLPPAGFHSTGTLVVQAMISGVPLNIGGNIALYRRASMYRLDVLSLGFPGTNATTSGLAGALLAPGGASIIYNGASGTLSAYSNANRTFYEAAPKASARAVVPLTESLAPGAADPLAALGTIVRQLHDVTQANVALTGRSVINGYQTDNLDVVVKLQRPGAALEDYHAQVALADDLDGFPVQILLSSTPSSSQAFGGSLRLDLTAISRETPADTIFIVPAGYARVNSIGAVLQAGVP